MFSFITKVFTKPRVAKVNPIPLSELEQKCKSEVYEEFGYRGVTSLSNLFKVFFEVSKECQKGPIDITNSNASTDVLLISKTHYTNLLCLAVKGKLYELQNKNK